MSSIDGGTVGSISQLQGRARGIYTPTAPGAVSVFSLAHGLAGTPVFVDVQPRNLLSAALLFVTADATNINITFAAAPLAGALNFYWVAEL